MSKLVWIALCGIAFAGCAADNRGARVDSDVRSSAGGSTGSTSTAPGSTAPSSGASSSTTSPSYENQPPKSSSSPSRY